MGRDKEQQALAFALERAVDGAGGLVLVSGEAGIGKTALLTTAMGQARAAGALVAAGTCWQGEGAPGYWPWIQVMRALRLASPEDSWKRAAAEAGGGLDRLLGTRSPVGVETSLFDVADAVTTVLQVLAR